MERRYYKCTFLTDIILNSTSATEGHSKTLNYIPGSNFLGIVARAYGKLENKDYDIFHSGNVHFGDGHLMIDGKRSSKKPAYWFYEKMDTDKKTIYLHHKISDDDRTKLTQNGKQLKQIRSGYFSINTNKIVSENIEHSYSLKSAYDSNKRGSKDKAMFGYDSLNSGTEWIFYIDAENEYHQLIEDELIGEKSIGRSKTAQYGRVKIDKLENYNPDISCENQTSYYDAELKKDINILLIYFDSCASFLDKYQQPTYQPSVKDLRLDDRCKINWYLSQIRTKDYSPWNGTRKTRDFDRVCIDKGSVIAVEIPEKFTLKEYAEKVKFGIGLFKNEGLGQVLINPSFLTKNKANAKELLDYSFQIETSISLNQSIVTKGKNDSTILALLENIQSEKDHQTEVLEEVNSFVAKNQNKMRKISPSQWGQVRSIAMSSSSKNNLLDSLFKGKDDREMLDNDKGFLVHGKAEEQWRKYSKYFEEAIEDMKLPDEYVIQFVINSASSMAKKYKKGVK